MQAVEFVDWTWSLTDEDKRAIARRAALVRAGTDERFLRGARSAAEIAIAGTGFDPAAANVAAAPENALDDGAPDLATWNRNVGNDLRAAYEDAMLALGAGTAIGKGHRRVLAEPMLQEIPDLKAALGLA
jgi:hypothetical protein